MRTFPCCRWLAFVYVGDRRLRDREGRGYARPGSSPSPDRLRYVWMSASFRSCVHVRCELRGCAGDDDRLVIACGDAVQGEGIPYSFGSSTSPFPFPPPSCPRAAVLLSAIGGFSLTFPASAALPPPRCPRVLLAFSFGLHQYSK